MNGLNEAAVSAMVGLPLEDLSYCLKLAKRLERLGVDGERASSGLCDLIERDAIPSE
ncbi:hypothetical protein [Paraeggerthella hongkongensis]|uniref:hypothetical protein n=1 Tax=Paraeggerthella hongkongensis TaxID=230658 RepID=UPI001476069F|nr:hypothetical protein [Paraeggerthella hongkongensis]